MLTQNAMDNQLFEIHTVENVGIDTKTKYTGTSLLRSPMGLGKSDLNGEVTVLFTGG